MAISDCSTKRELQNLPSTLREMDLSYKLKSLATTSTSRASGEVNGSAPGLLTSMLEAQLADISKSTITIMNKAISNLTWTKTSLLQKLKILPENALLIT